MTPRTLSLVALCCAVALLTGCGKQPTAKKGVKKTATKITSVAEDVVPLESLRADAKPAPSVRQFLHDGSSPVLATDIHREYVRDFVGQSGNGIGRPGPRWTPPLQWTELVATGQGQRERVWLILDRQLMSVNALTGPAVYVQSPMRVSELVAAKLDGATAETMRLDAFETAALKKLRAGDEVVLWSDDRRLRMLGAIRARKDCLSCHSNSEEGDLLGAFTYTLEAQSEETPETHRLKDLTGLTDRQISAVWAIEAVGGKLVRTSDGPVTEARLTFSWKLDADSGRRSTRPPLRGSALPRLLEFPELTVLDVSDSFVSDVGLKTFAKLKNLKRLDLRETRVTEAGVAELKKALPECEILASR